MKKYKHVFGPEGYHMWQVTVLGRTIRSGALFSSPEEAACNCQFFKNYLYSEFKISFPESLDAEQHAALAYRLSVDSSDCQAVFRALPEPAQSFIANHRTELEAYRDAQPEESVFSKFRRSEAFNRQADIRAWVLAGEAAECRQKSFSAINSEYFFSLLGAASNRLSDALLPLYRAAKMHSSVTDPLLVARSAKLAELISNLSATAEYVQHLISELKAEELAVASAVATLEAARPALV